MQLPQKQIYLGLFFLLFTANAVVGHFVGLQYLDRAAEMQRVHREGGDPSTVELGEGVTVRAASMLVLNLPFFGALGWIGRSAEPAPGILYWIALVLGATYLPAFITLCTYLLLNAPQVQGLPGVNWTDDPKDDDDDERK